MSIVSEQAFHWESDQENGVRVCGGGVGENGSTTTARACLAEWDRYRGSPEKTQRGILCHTAVSTVCQGMSSVSKSLNGGSVTVLVLVYIYMYIKDTYGGSKHPLYGDMVSTDKR